MPRFAILGKNQEGIVVRRYGKLESKLDLYDDRLNLINSYDVKLGEEALIKSIALNPSGATAFYIEEGKMNSILYGRMLNARFQPTGKPVPLDTLLGFKTNGYEAAHFTSSQNRYFYSFHHEVQGETGLKQVNLKVVNRSLDTAYDAAFMVKGSNMKVEEVLVSNTGSSWVFLSEIPEKNLIPAPQIYEVHYLKADSIVERGSYSFTTELAIFQEPNWTYDNRNQMIAFSGFVNQPDSRGNDAAAGLLYHRIDPWTGEKLATGTQDFSKAFIFQLTGLDTSKIEDRIYTFKIRDMIPRMDGGAIVVTESEYTDISQDDFSTYVSPGFSNFRTVTVFYYNDVVLFNINPNGNMDWQAILRKKQISEDDNGSFSSFAVMNTGDRLRFIYPVEIYGGADAGEYQIMGDGNLNREILFNQAEKDVMLVPKLARQITPIEMLIPSYKKGALRLVKITY